MEIIEVTDASAAGLIIAHVSTTSYIRLRWQLTVCADQVEGRIHRYWKARVSPNGTDPTSGC